MLKDKSSCSYIRIFTPLPRVLDEELKNDVITRTILENEHLFSIVTPINIDRLACLLVNHPILHLSLWCCGFARRLLAVGRHATWCLSTTKDYFKPRKYKENIKCFLWEQRDVEISLNRFSELFGPDLLPGMYAMPIHVIPIPYMVNFRLITNLSAGTSHPTWWLTNPR